MDGHDFAEHLTCFGLTRQEAAVYHKLLQNGKQTGYEIAKTAGISRSNAYSALAALVEKGAAYLVEEAAKKYVPVRLNEFCDNYISRIKEEKKWLEANLPDEKIEEEGYITIEGEENIRNKIRRLLTNAEERVYISGYPAFIREFEPELLRLISQNKKVVVLTEETIDMPGAISYLSEKKGTQIGLITDSRYALTGEFGYGSLNNCLYSGKRNFVLLYKNVLANEIKLIKMCEGEEPK